MGAWELVVTAIGLSMDAFAVAVCKGLSLRNLRWRQCAVVGLYFGAFQALMTLIGYFLGVQFREYITSVDHWIAFALLALIGAKMLHEALSGGEEAGSNDASLSFRAMLPLAVATSIDALAVGVTFAFLRVQIVPAVASIGAITFALSFAGVKIGNVFGDRFQKKAEICGGIILILIGAKILLEHLGILG